MSPKATIVKWVPSRWCDPPVRDSLASQNCGPSKAWQHSSQRKKRDFGLFFRLTASKSFIRIRPNVKFGVVLPRSARFHIAGRSEEHTSELQSRGHLVCRLLLEKKKTKK